MKRYALLLVSLCLLAGGCAGAGLRAGDSQQEIQALKARILELQREAAMNQVELAQLRQQVAALEARGGGPAPRPTTAPRPAAPAPRTHADEPPKITAPPSRPTAAPIREPAPAEPIEEVDIELPPNEPQPPPPRRTPPSIAAPAPARPAVPASVPPAATTPTPPSPGENESPETLSPANQVLYDRGYSLYYQGHYVDAETSFQRFLQANAGSELADNAQYWIGECRYARNDLKGALSAFRETIERYPKGNKVADALLKSGQCLEGLGDVEGARVTYREVARRFSGTAAAAAAEERRAKLP